jgi:predicted double-glycine peptidase
VLPFISYQVFMPNKKQRISAFGGLMGIIGLTAAYFFLPLLLPFLEQHREVYKQLRAWTMGARFVTDKGVVLQKSINDCGPASLKTILTAYGIDRSVPDPSSRLPLTSKGTSMLDLRNVSTKMGLRAKSWSIHPEDLPRVPLPAIAFVNKNHFVVLRRFITPEVLEVDDPALGRIRWQSRSFKKAWSGEMLVFDPAWTPL